MRTEYYDKISGILGDASLSQIDQAAALNSLIDELITEEKPEPAPEWHWPGMFNPGAGDEYVHPWVDTPGYGTRHNNNQECTDFDRASGLCCETAAEAAFVKAHTEARLAVIDRLKALNEGWRPDWDAGNELKFHLSYLPYEDEIVISQGATGLCQSPPDCFYAKSTLICQQVISELGEEKVKLAIWPKYEAE